MSPTLTKLRELKQSEISLEVAQNESKNFISCYWFLLESKTEASEKQIEEALAILFRNIEILQLCIRKENGVYLFYKMEEEIIPLQVLKDHEASEVFRTEVQTSIDSATGPLWRATYITNKEERKTNTSNVLFTFHHAIADAYTALVVCNGFLKALNDVIGKKVQKIYDFGQLNDGYETKKLIEERREFLTKNPEYITEIKAFHNKFDNMRVNVLTECFAAPKDAKQETKYIHGEIDKETNKKLIKVFKSKGITFHAGVSSVLNWVLMEIFYENGLAEKEIDLPTLHAMDLRRYWNKSSSVQLGSHVAIIKLLSKIDKNVSRENFWEHAKQFNMTLKNAIENMQAFDDVSQHITPTDGEPQVDFTKLNEDGDLHPKTYYWTNNMGDISSILQGHGDDVKIKWVSRGSTVHSRNTLLVLYFQTFEGRFIYCMAYSAHLVTQDFANKCSDKLKNKLKTISNSQ